MSRAIFIAFLLIQVTYATNRGIPFLGHPKECDTYFAEPPIVKLYELFVKDRNHDQLERFVAYLQEVYLDLYPEIAAEAFRPSFENFIKNLPYSEQVVLVDNILREFSVNEQQSKLLLDAAPAVKESREAYLNFLAESHFSSLERIMKFRNTFMRETPKSKFYSDLQALDLASYTYLVREDRMKMKYVVVDPAEVVKSLDSFFIIPNLSAQRDTHKFISFGPSLLYFRTDMNAQTIKYQQVLDEELQKFSDKNIIEFEYEFIDRELKDGTIFQFIALKKK